MATKKKTTNTNTGNKKSGNSFKTRLFGFIRKLLFWFFGLSIACVIILKYVPVYFTPLMAIRAIENKMEGRENNFSHKWVPIEELSLNLQTAVVASEDGKFISHNGFDFDSMYKAFKSNNNGKKIKGGSTITQQTAKNVFLWQGRSYVRKALEAYFTALIEIFWSKKRIMEVYLNSIEMGDGVYGAQAACQYWYGKDANSLTKTEAAGIAAILPNPRKYKANGSSAYINQRKRKIVHLMVVSGELRY